MASCCAATPASADPIGLQWGQPGGSGNPVVISYSFSNLLDGSFLLISPADLRAAVEESLGLWAAVAPLHFVERPDSGPAPSDAPYAGEGHPQIRIGHHVMTEFAHAYYPGTWNGLAGDIHFSSGAAWMLDADQWDFLEVLTHELGHALGLPHLFDREAIMNPWSPPHYNGLGTAFLLPADIEAIQALYGAGRGSVAPTPEPSTLLLLGLGAAVAGRRARRALTARPG